MVKQNSRSGKSNSHPDGGGDGPIKEAEAEIIARTDIEGFYRGTLGFTIKGAGPNAQGWLSVLSKDDSGEDEKKPSAAINVGKSKLRGKYTTRNKNEQALSIFEAGARFGSLGDWRAVRQHLADRAGVTLPRSARVDNAAPRRGANGEGSSRGASVGAASDGRPGTPAPSADGTGADAACLAGLSPRTRSEIWKSKEKARLFALVHGFYRDELGLTIPSQRPDGSGLWGFEYDDPDEGGWLPVKHKGVDGNEVVAAINVKSKWEQGCYRGPDGERLSLFQAGVKFGRFLNPEHALAFVANQADVRHTPPDPKHKPADASLSFYLPRARRGYVEQFCKVKKPISPEAVALCGGEVASYPRNAPVSQIVLAFPVFPHLLRKPSAYCLLRADGQDISVYQGPGNDPMPTKVMTTRTAVGFLGAFGLKNLARAKVVWKTEGVSDLLALQTAIPPEQLSQHVVLSNGGGCAEVPSEFHLAALAGKTVYVVGDCDGPGQHGAKMWHDALAGTAKEVRNVVLPFPIMENHGKDLRDYLADHTYDHLFKLAQKCPARVADVPPPAAAPDFLCGEDDDDADPGAVVSGGDDGEPAYEIDWIDSKTFAAAHYKLEWLVKGLFVKDMPCVWAGPKKSLKTSIGIDLAVSLAAAVPFLGEFTVPKRRRVAFLSGESGEANLQETARRVCEEKCVGLAELTVFWGFRLPKLASAKHVAAVTAALKEREIEVLFIDPAYLCLLAGIDGKAINEASMFQIGPLLMSISEACKGVGCTMILMCHARKNAKAPHRPMDLEDIAYAGFQEFARQWLLVNPRKTFKYDGQHYLHLQVGGSTGQGGLWALDVWEGRLNYDDFSGRVWEPTVNDAAAARAREQEEQESRSDKDDESKVIAGLRKALGGTEGTAPHKEVRARSGLSNDKFAAAVARLVDDDVLEVVEMPKKPGVPGRAPEGIRFKVSP
jgi:hypothetical protein